MQKTLLILIMLVTALGIRLHKADQPFLSFHPGRQYGNALTSRALIPSEVSHQYLEEMSWFIEPPLMEWLTASIWSQLGSTPFWVPRLLSSIFWILGGYFIWQIVRQLTSTYGAFTALMFYWLFPYGVLVGRSFMVDSPMMFFYLMALNSLIKFNNHMSTRNYLTTLFHGLIATLVKPAFLTFPLIGAYAAFNPFKFSLKNSQTLKDLIYYFSLIIFPGIYILLFISGFAQVRLFIEVLMTVDFWKGWALQLDTVLGPWVIISSFIGFFLLNKKSQKLSLLTLIGYVIFGILNTDLFRRLDHYHLMIIPIVALCLGALGDVFIRQLKEKIPASKFIMALVFFAILISTARESRLRYTRLNPEIQKSSQQPLPLNMVDETKLYEEIGHVVNQSQNCVLLTHSYGTPLKFHANIQGTAWLKRGDYQFLQLTGQFLRNVPINLRFDAQTSQAPDFFIVTDFREWELQKDLREFLLKKFSVISQNDRYLIFDLKRPL